MKKLVILDLDGTLLDTIADLTHSANHALWQNDFPTHDVKEYNFFVGDDINELFERTLPEGKKTAGNILKVKGKFLEYYGLHDTDHSIPYSDVPELLTLLQEREIRLTVVSNKYQAATRKLVAHFSPSIRSTEVLGQRERVETKPDPSIVNEIVERASISKEDTLYVGDSDIDMQTVINSEVTSYGMTWSFRSRTELEKYTPDHIAEEAEDIFKFI